MRSAYLSTALTAFAIATGAASLASAQTPQPTRREVIEQEQAEKAKDLHPYVLTATERALNKLEDITVNGVMRWHPYFEGAYHGSGFTLGAGYMHHVSPYNLLDVRGSYSIKGYKRMEAEFIAPRMFQRRAELSVLGGWREATQVAFYGLGTDTPQENRTNYSFKQPYVSGLMTYWPTRKFLMLRGGAEITQYTQNPGEGSFPSVETVYTPQTLSGLGAEVQYWHTQGTLGFDTRTAPLYSRRGGFYGVTLHNYVDPDDLLGFREVDYEALHHFPILREAWVISLRGLVQTTHTKEGQEIPFFMLPSLGGGHNLRGYESHRFRDRDSLLLQAEWRIMVNRFIDTAFFLDTGMVAPRTRDLGLDGLTNDYGFGVRFHSPFATMLRIEVAHSSEGYKLVFASSSPF
jgi:surface antigen Omp85-like protein